MALPIAFGIAGVCDRISLTRLVACTGTRFLRSLADSGTPSGGAVDLFPDSERPAARHLFAIICGKAPQALTLAEVLALIAAAKVAMAFPVLEGLGELLKPAIREAPRGQVCLRQCFLRGCPVLSGGLLSVSADISRAPAFDSRPWLKLVSKSVAQQRRLKTSKQPA